MAVREIVLMGDPVLREEAEQVSAFDRELKALVRDMYETMYHAEGVGLAAPQIGISKRVIVIDLRKDDEPDARLALINPSVVWSSDETEKSPEGCLSIPGLEEVVQRPLGIQVEASDVHGAPISVDAGALLARVLQHEIEHLDGKLLLDRLNRVKRELIKRRLKKLAKAAPVF